MSELDVLDSILVNLEIIPLGEKKSYRTEGEKKSYRTECDN